MKNSLRVVAEWTAQNGKRKRLIIAEFFAMSDALAFEARKTREAAELKRNAAPLYETFIVRNAQGAAI